MKRPLFHVERLNTHHPVRWASMLALALVPLLVAGLLLSTAWGRDQRLHSINAAVVNSDEAVTVNGQVVPLGRQLSAEIVSKPSTNVTWTLSDPADAAEGLATGRYAAVVTIPKGFSRAATSVGSASTAEQAVIDVTTSPASSVEDAQIARQVADIATQSLNSTLTGSYLERVYVGFNGFGKQLVTMGKGAQQLATGAKQLDDGVSKASAGTAGLARGLSQLDGNGQKLTAGARELGAGADQLATGINSYTAGTGKVVDGIGQLSAGLSKLDAGLRGAGSGAQFGQLDRLASGAQQVAAGTRGVSQGLGAYQKQLDAWSSGAAPIPSQVDGAYAKQFTQQCTQQVRAGSVDAVKRWNDSLTPQVRQQIRERVDQAVAQVQQNSPVPLTPEQVAALREQLDQALTGDYLDQLVGDPAIVQQLADQVCPQLTTAVKPVFDGGFRAGTATASAALDHKDPTSGQSLKSGAAAVATGAGQLATGVGRLVDQLPGAIAAQMSQLTNAVGQLDAGARTLYEKSLPLKQGGAQLGAGAGKLSDGATRYADGVAQYTQGVARATDGAQQLAGGMTQLDAGAGKLAGGVQTFATKVKEGATKVPSYSQAEREKLSTVVATPVVGAADGVSTPLAQLVSLVLVVVAWLASMLTWLVARPVASRVLTSSRPSWQIAGATMLPGALLATAQGALLGVLGAWALHLGWGRGAGLVGFMLLVSLAFSAVNHALAAWLGSIGRSIALVLATVTAAVGTVSAVPGLFRWVHQASPLAPALTGVRALVADAAMGAGPVATLFGLALLAAILVQLSVVRRRRLSPEAYRRDPDAV